MVSEELVYNSDPNGWKFENDEWIWVNSEEDGKDLYAVRIWSGKGYELNAYCSYADDEQKALAYVVAWLEENDVEILADNEYAEQYEEVLKELDGDVDQTIERLEKIFVYVDCTNEGGAESHYVNAENLAIVKFPKHQIPKRTDAAVKQ